MKNLLMLIALLLVSCTEQQISDPIVEDGIVVQTILRPYHTHTMTVPVTTVDTKGHVNVHMETTTDTYREQYWIVFTCQHGQFAIDNEAVWHKVSPGMRVKIRYREIKLYKTKNGQKTHVGDNFKFEDAWPANSEWNVFDVKVR